MALPKKLFIREEKDRSDGTVYWLAFTIQDEAVDGNGPTIVGVYQLIESQRLIKRVHSAQNKKGGR